MFWQIEEIKEVKIEDKNKFTFDYFSGWVQKKEDYFDERYIKKIKFIFEKIGEINCYWEGVNDFFILKHPTEHKFVFLFGNLVLIRENTEYTNFFVIVNEEFIDPYGSKRYLFGFDLITKLNFNREERTFIKNNYEIDKFSKTTEGIKFVLINIKTRQMENLIFSWSEFDFEDLDNPKRIVKFKL